MEEPLEYTIIQINLLNEDHFFNAEAEEGRPEAFTPGGFIGDDCRHS